MPRRRGGFHEVCGTSFPGGQLFHEVCGTSFPAPHFLAGDSEHASDLAFYELAAARIAGAGRLPGMELGLGASNDSSAIDEDRAPV